MMPEKDDIQDTQKDIQERLNKLEISFKDLLASFDTVCLIFSINSRGSRDFSGGFLCDFGLGICWVSESFFSSLFISFLSAANLSNIFFLL